MSDSPASPSFFVSGGTVPLEAASYVARDADRRLLEALRGGSYCYVLTSRQMGKTSLSVRTMEALRNEGARTAFIDLTRIGGRNVTPEQWYAGLLGEAGRGLGSRAALMAYWKAHPEMGPMQRFFGALHEVGLAAPAPMVVFIDEIDATRSLSFSTDEFFAGIRECYNRRAQDPAMARLTFCLIGVAVPSDLMADSKLTPFNVGERIVLRGFTAEEAKPLAAGLGTDGAALVARVVYWTGGQPFLTQSLCRRLVEEHARRPADVDLIVTANLFGGRARETNINLADVGNRVLNGYDDPGAVAHYRADVLSLYASVLKGRRVQDDESNRLVAVLKLAGLLDVADGRLRVRNRIYAHVFGPAWIAENMPVQESERQRRAYRRGVLRASLAASVLLVVFGAIATKAAFATRQAGEARTKAETAEAKAKIAESRSKRAGINIAKKAALLASTNAKLKLSSKQVLDREKRIKEAYRLENKLYKNLVYEDQENKVFLERAKSSAANAKSERDHALLAQRDALDAKRAAQADERKARIAQLDSERLLYASNMQAVSDAYDHGSGRQASETLEIRPGKNVRPGWERRHFEALLDQGVEYPGPHAKGDDWHRDRIGRVAFTPDGDLLTLDGSVEVGVSGGQASRIVYDGRGTLRRWSRTTGGCVASLSPTDVRDGVALDVSPRGDYVYVTTTRGGFQRRAVDDLAQRTTVRNGGETLSGLALGADARRALAWRGLRREIVDLDTGRSLGSLGRLDADQAEGDDYALFPNGDDVLAIHRQAGGKSAFLARLHPTSDGRLQKVWQFPGKDDASRYDGVQCATISADGGRVAFSDTGGFAQVVDARTGTRVGERIEHATTITALAFDGATKGETTRLATGSEDGVVKVSDVEDGTVRAVFPGRRRGIGSLAFSPGGNELAAGTAVGFAERFSVAGFHGPTGVLEADDRDGDAKDRWIVVLGSTIRLYDAKEGRLVRTIESPRQACASLSSDGRTLISYGPQGRDGTSRVHVWDPETGSLRRSFDIGPAEEVKVRLSPDGRRVLAYGVEKADGTSQAGWIALYDAASGRRLASAVKRDGPLHGVCFSPDGTKIAAIFRSGTLLAYDLRKADPLSRSVVDTDRETREDDDRALSAAFSSDGKRLAVGWESGHIKLVDAETGHTERDWWGRSGQISSLSLSRDDRTLFTVSTDRTLRMWNVDKGKPVGTRHFPDPIERVEATSGNTVYVVAPRRIYVLRAASVKESAARPVEETPERRESTVAASFNGDLTQARFSGKPLLAIVGPSSRRATVAARAMLDDGEVGTILRRHYTTSVVLVDRIRLADTRGDDPTGLMKSLVDRAASCPAAIEIVPPPQDTFADKDLPIQSALAMPFDAPGIEKLLRSLAHATPRISQEELGKIRAYLLDQGSPYVRDALEATKKDDEDRLGRAKGEGRNKEEERLSADASRRPGDAPLARRPRLRRTPRTHLILAEALPNRPFP